MTKEELEKEAEEYSNNWKINKKADLNFAELVELRAVIYKAYKDGAEPREKRITELEEKISVLLSCKNCPENKGGYICQKEYKNKCLAQKIQYIKELQEEIENLKKTYRKQRNKRIDELQKANAELTKDMANAIPLLEKATVISDLLNKAKEIIKSLLLIADNKVSQMEFQLCVADAKQFISEVEK